jgi:hypothetical protein
VSLFTEELLWCVADTCGKIFFSSTLLHSNFMSIEHRRMVAMRVVEEANRWAAAPRALCCVAGAGWCGVRP